MDLLRLDTLSEPIVFLVFAAAAAVVWFAGGRLSRYADALSKMTGSTDVLIGTLLLGGVTSLPEVVTTITASVEGDPGIAINNLFGGVALQVAILAVGDYFLRKRSITSLIGSQVVHLQAVVGILLLSSAACIMVVGDYGVAHIGIGSFFILLLFLGGFYLINYFQSIHWWKSDPEIRDDISRVRDAMKEEVAQHDQRQQHDEQQKRQSDYRAGKKHLVFYIILCALAIAVAGYMVVQSAQTISEQTGLGRSLVGAVLVALATSLPEISTTISSVKMKEYRLAFSNIFGTNIFTVGFVFLADVFYVKGPILNEVDNFSLFGSMLGVLLTAVYLIGLLVRMKRTFLNLGYDSLLVAALYVAGVVFMFSSLSA